MRRTDADKGDGITVEIQKAIEQIENEIARMEAALSVLRNVQMANGGPPKRRGRPRKNSYQQVEVETKETTKAVSSGKKDGRRSAEFREKMRKAMKRRWAEKRKHAAAAK